MYRTDDDYCELDDLDDGRFALYGDLTFATVTGVYELCTLLFDVHEDLVVDMYRIRRADSAGLALLLELMSWARSLGLRIEYENIPAQIAAIARISEVEALLSGHAETG